MKKIYTCFTTSYIHEGHLNIINEAQKYGELTVGVLSDKSLLRFDKFPLISISERIKLIESIEGVSKVIVQEEVFYDDILARINPDYVIHGDNWKSGPLSNIRSRLINKLEAIGGSLIEVPYSFNPEIARIDSNYKMKLSMPEFRRPRLRKILDILNGISVIEAHNGLTGLIAENTVVHDSTKGLNQFDAIWISSLTDSTVKGKPDIELVDLTSRLITINEIMEVTTKPIILDGDSGGLIEHFVYNVRTLERIGVSAIIIEDKTGLKKNSLFGTEANQTQEKVEVFSEKIRRGKKSQLTNDFMIIARIESLILGIGLNDAILRAKAYVAAGADGIMIHSKSPNADEIIDFINEFRKFYHDVPIVVVPTTYNQISFDELINRGANIVIYANQLIRSSYPSMIKTAEAILKDGNSFSIENEMLPIKEIISMIG